MLWNRYDERCGKVAESIPHRGSLLAEHNWSAEEGRRLIAIIGLT
jgi:hypothetical protein